MPRKKSIRSRRRKRSTKKKKKTKRPKKRSLRCNKPQKSWRSGKKRVVKACKGGREKLVHYGATGYGHNYNTKARRSFRARHRCDTAKDIFTARYWACKDLWTKGGDRLSPPRRRRKK